jgi:hypothetical protein
MKKHTVWTLVFAMCWMLGYDHISFGSEIMGDSKTMKSPPLGVGGFIHQPFATVLSLSNSEGHITGSFTSPSDVNLIEKVVIYRKAGVQPYPCGSRNGSFMKQFLRSELSSNTVFSFSDHPVGGIYRYSICVYDSKSTIVSHIFSDPILILDPTFPKTFVFFTEDKFNGNMRTAYGDESDATPDTRCQLAARHAKLSSTAILTWRAVISYASNQTAATRVRGMPAFYNIQDEFLADYGSEWFKSRGGATLYTEWGRVLQDDSTIWTGSDDSGGNSATPACTSNGVNWTTRAVGSTYGTIGNVNYFGTLPNESGWFSMGSRLCSASAHLLCASSLIRDNIE